MGEPKTTGEEELNCERDQDSVSSEESEDDDLVLEGAIVRNEDASSSDESKADTKPPVKRKESGHNAPKTQKKRKKDEIETIKVDFTFCDMNEKFFHGIKSILHSSSTIYQPHSSALTDLMIENVSIGTVVSTEGDEEGTVFGFASVLNVTTYQESPGIKGLKEACLSNCPGDRQKELDIVLSGKTKRPAGFLLHSRMINMPLEIVEVLHEQLVLDMDWAVENAEGGPEERKSLDFGAFVILAPCQKEGVSIIYRYFDDEIFAGRAEFVYTMDAPKSFSKEEKQFVNVIVLTKTGHRDAMKDLKSLIHGALPVKS